tara:strand:- start:161 stop:490 length:330 start_codon:yes stop_codon:yes gene_type:complete
MSKLPETIETWVTALESGEYGQCMGTLHKDGGYCCLGVYAKVVLGYSDAKITSKTNIEGPTDVYNEIISSKDMDRKCYSKGIDMNDYGDSFIDIAKMIRETYMNHNWEG